MMSASASTGWRSALTRVTLICTLLLAALTVAAPWSSAAPAKTALSISKLTAGRGLSIAGRLTVGADSMKVAVLANDSEGDETIAPADQGLDLATVSISADPVKEIAIFSFTVHDPFPSLTISPGFVYLWQIKVDGNDTGKHLQIGNLGGFPPATGPYFHFCTISASEFLCDHQLEGSMEDGTISVPVPFNLLPADRGSVIGTGTAIGGAETLTSTIGMGGLVFENNLGGETLTASDYTIPGGVRIGIAKAGTRVSKVPTTILATIKGSSFSALLPRPRPGLYVVVAKTCFGVKTCVYSSKTVRV